MIYIMLTRIFLPISGDQQGRHHIQGHPVPPWLFHLHQLPARPRRREVHISWGTALLRRLLRQPLCQEMHPLYQAYHWWETDYCIIYSPNLTCWPSSATFGLHFFILNPVWCEAYILIKRFVCLYIRLIIRIIKITWFLIILWFHHFFFNC